MGVARVVPADVDQIVADLVAEHGTDYESVILETVTAIRDQPTVRPSCGAMTIPLGPDIEAMADLGRPGTTPQFWIGNQHLRTTFDCAGAVPSADEVNALERIFTTAGRALVMFRDARRLADFDTDEEVIPLTGMDPGPSGPGLPVPDDTATNEPSGEPE